jgi:hypothetical protein
MDLNQQIQLLTENAPQDGKTPGIVAAIAPVLKSVAGQLRHREYYLLQSLDSRWVVTTLSNRAHPDVEKRAIYAFPSLKDATNHAIAPKEAGTIAVAVPVTHILFQMVAIDAVDSLVFFETPGDFSTGIEVSRETLQQSIRAELQKHLQKSSSPQESQLPPDLA